MTSQLHSSAGHFMLIHAVNRTDLPPLTLAPRFRTEIVYFSTSPGDKSAPANLAEGEYWIDLAEARKWLDEYVIYIVSPLDAASKAEIELSEDHESFLQWLVDHNVSHVRVE